MTDRRRYTGTQTLQLVWSGVALLALVALRVAPGGARSLPSPVAFLVTVVVWFAGLVALGFRERRHWQRLVDASSFQRQTGPREADLERIVGGHSVQVATRVAGLLSGTHTAVWAPVNGVDASFTITVTHRVLTGNGGGLTTGSDALDERFVIEGAEGNVAKLLSPEVQEALLEMETPGAWMITGERVEYDVPFTRLEPEELDTIGAAVAVVVDRLEALGADRERS